MSPRFASASRETLGDFVVRSIQEAVLAGELKPGDRIVEADLAEQMGISRAPVREAIRELVAQGLLVTSPRHGTFVRPWSLKSFIEIYTIRGDLEDMAVRLVAATAGPADLDRLDGILDGLRSAVAAADTLQIVRQDMALHRAILDITGNEQLQRAWSGMATVAAKLVADPHPEIGGLVEMHEVLVDVLRRRDPDGAAMTWFRREGGERLLKLFGLTLDGLAEQIGSALTREFVRVARLGDRAGAPLRRGTNGAAAEAGVAH